MQWDTASLVSVWLIVWHTASVSVTYGVTHDVIYGVSGRKRNAFISIQVDLIYYSERASRCYLRCDWRCVGHVCDVNIYSNDERALWCYIVYMNPIPDLISFREPFLTLFTHFFGAVVSKCVCWCKETEVHKSWRNGLCNKSPGPDSIPNSTLKEFAWELAPVVADIYNLSMLYGVIPNQLKQSIVLRPKTYTIKNHWRRRFFSWYTIPIHLRYRKWRKGSRRSNFYDKISSKLDRFQFAKKGRSTT